MVRIIFLGVGGWISEPSLGHTSILIENSKGERMLLDAGEGVYAKLKHFGYDVDDIDYVIITHAHGDHILGLPTLVQMCIHNGLEKLCIITFYETVETIKTLLKITGYNNAENFVKIVELEPYKEFNVGSYKLTFIEALHTIPAVSVKVNVDGKCIVYSGDTTYNPKLKDFAKECNLLIHEASNYSQDAYKYGHSSYQDAIKIAAEANVDILALVHYYKKPQPIEVEKILDRIKKICLPYPGMFLEI
ncbi:MAG: MBL fold metallo-hydrolase [Nitrososphaeria archaeon]|nr:MBL fold metallo-hydrolase [Nitrososphaeria archaeon]